MDDSLPSPPDRSINRSIPHYDERMAPDPNALIPYDLHELDKVTGGIRPGQLVVVTSDPGAGKTTLMLQFLRSAIRQGHPVHLVSLEMSEADIRQRLFGGAAEVTLQSLDTGEGREPLSDLSAASAMFPGTVLDLEVRGDLELMDFLMLTEDKGDRILAIDCIDLVDPDYVGGNGRTLGGISRRLKKYALESGRPVIVTARHHKKFLSKSPLMADADVVIKLDRPDAAVLDHERSGEADIHVVKNRMGPIASFTVMHQLHYSKFRSLTS